MRTILGPIEWPFRWPDLVRKTQSGHFGGVLGVSQNVDICKKVATLGFLATFWPPLFRGLTRGFGQKWPLLQKSTINV